MMENFNFGWAASGLTIILYILPIVSFLNYFGKKTKFDNIPAARLFTNYANCLIWYFYGSIIFKSEIIYTFMIGGIISLFLIIIYLYCELKKYLLDSILNSILIIIGTLCSYEWFGNIIIEQNIVGKICLLVCISIIIIKMPNLYNGINEKNYLLIPVNYSIISFPAHFCWIVYALIIGDFYHLISNIIGITESIIEIILYIYYKKEYPIINDDEAASAIKIDEDPKKYSNSVKARPVKIVTNDTNK